MQKQLERQSERIFDERLMSFCTPTPSGPHNRLDKTAYSASLAYRYIDIKRIYRVFADFTLLSHKEMKTREES